MPTRECPACGEDAVAVLDIPSIGTRGDTVVFGTVHYRPGGSGGWRLYVHE